MDSGILKYIWLHTIEHSHTLNLYLRSLKYKLPMTGFLFHKEILAS